MNQTGEIVGFLYSPAIFRIPKEISRHVPLDQQQPSQPS